MNIKYLVTTIILASSLVGCGTLPPANFSVPNVGLSKKKIDAEIKSLIVTVARPDEKTGDLDFRMVSVDINGSGGSAGDLATPQLWQASLTDALNRMAIFQDDAAKKINLSVKILKLDVPNGGFSFTTEATARYEIMDRKNGDLIFSQDITSSGTTPVDYAFAGIARMRESINRAVQNNITQFLQALETVDASKPMFPSKVTVNK